MGGFKVPILHGLCFFGFAGKAVYERYVSHRNQCSFALMTMTNDLAFFRFGPIKNIKVRFAGTVVPGQTLVTEMWKDGQKVIFQTKVKETGKLAIGNAAAELVGHKGKM
jgi:multifunctional beta-oxidation protein